MHEQDTQFRVHIRQAPPFQPTLDATEHLPGLFLPALLVVDLPEEDAGKQIVGIDPEGLAERCHCRSVVSLHVLRHALSPVTQKGPGLSLLLHLFPLQFPEPGQGHLRFLRLSHSPVGLSEAVVCACMFWRQANGVLQGRPCAFQVSGLKPGGAELVVDFCVIRFQDQRPFQGEDSRLALAQLPVDLPQRKVRIPAVWKVGDDPFQLLPGVVVSTRLLVQCGQVQSIPKVPRVQTQHLPNLRPGLLNPTGFGVEDAQLVVDVCFPHPCPHGPFQHLQRLGLVPRLVGQQPQVPERVPVGGIELDGPEKLQPGLERATAAQQNLAQVVACFGIVGGVRQGLPEQPYGFPVVLLLTGIPGLCQYRFPVKRLPAPQPPDQPGHQRGDPPHPADMVALRNVVHAHFP